MTNKFTIQGSVTKFIAEFIDGGPGCGRDDCIIQELGGSSTAAYYPPVYNAKNENINPDMNTTYRDRRCNSCGKSWTEAWQNGTRIS
jgi:hypothetical protein